MSIKYELQEPFKYGKGGQFYEAQYLEVEAPNGKVSKFAAQIELIILQSIKNISSSTPSQQASKEIEKETSGKEIVMGIAYGGGDVYECTENLRKILVAPNMCKVDGEEKFTDVLYNEMSFSDIKGLLGEYAKNFFDIFPKA